MASGQQVAEENVKKFTALVASKTQVLLVGNAGAARAAVLAQPRANERQVALDLQLARLRKSLELKQ